VEACTPGTIGAILRREGLYSSQIQAWKKQQQQNRLAPQKRGRKAVDNQLAHENARMAKEIRKLNECLRRANLIVEAQKKLCDILGLEVPPIQETEVNE
jgi:hypothetical protein